ncbi:MAG: saccharopine dehydrogenase NADP-binding domain-containing protein, partial [Myxococcota bacterium]
MTERPFDVVLYGATGFTGRQTVAYFAAHAPPGLRWAVAGRSADKLAAVAGGRPVVVADALDRPAIDALAAQARVVLTTAGPFAQYGDPLVDACVAHHTDYVDITGETAWVRRVIDRHHARAAADGTRIVPFCGYDSVPSDLGALMVVEWIRSSWGQPTVRVLGAFSARGGFNGGTIATVFAQTEAGLAEIADPVLLCPDLHRTAAERARNPDRRAVEWSADLQRWLAPFFMAPTNTRVVRRSAALAHDWDEGYARPALVPFAYDEALEMRGRLGAWAVLGGTGLAAGMLSTGVGRWLARPLLPAPGEGPSEAAMNGGFYRTRLVGEAADGRKVLGTFAGEGDPGNRGTVRMLCEAALLLATSDRAA